MSSRERRAERIAAWEKENEVRLAAEAIERDRKAALGMWERIDEADASDDVKEILHMLATKLGLES